MPGRAALHISCSRTACSRAAWVGTASCYPGEQERAQALTSKTLAQLAPAAPVDSQPYVRFVAALPPRAAAGCEQRRAAQLRQVPLAPSHLPTRLPRIIETGKQNGIKLCTAVWIGKLELCCMGTCSSGVAWVHAGCVCAHRVEELLNLRSLSRLMAAMTANPGC